jgi:hypothetical protein
LLGFISFLAVLLVSLILSLIVGFLAKFIYLNTGGNLNEAKYTTEYILFGGALLAAGLHFIFCGAVWKRIFWLNLTVGILAGWWLLLLVSSFLLPGGSYLFLLAVAGGLIACLILIFRESNSIFDPVNFNVLLLFSIPALLVFIPLIYLLSEAFGEDSFSPVMLLITLLMTTMISFGFVISATLKKSAPAIIGIAALIFLTAGIVPRANGKQNPAYKNLFFAQNADTNKANQMPIARSVPAIAIASIIKQHPFISGMFSLRCSFTPGRIKPPPSEPRMSRLGTSARHREARGGFG